MSNANVNAAAGGGPSNSPVARQMYGGYVDAAAGKGYPDAYERMTEAEQRNYEIGRYMAAMVRGRGVEPNWDWLEGSGAMFRRLLGDVDGRRAVKELNEYVRRDATANSFDYAGPSVVPYKSFLQRQLERPT